MSLSTMLAMSAAADEIFMAEYAALSTPASSLAVSRLRAESMAAIHMWYSSFSIFSSRLMTSSAMSQLSYITAAKERSTMSSEVSFISMRSSFTLFGQYSISLLLFISLTTHTTHASDVDFWW